MKKPEPIFKPGDFSHWISNELAQHLANEANAKLQSLGIDADTPEKLKRLERIIESISSRFQFWKDQAELRERRLAELERQLSDTSEKLRLSEGRVAELERILEHRVDGSYAQQLEQRLADLEQELEQLRRQLDLLRKSIAEAPIVWGCDGTESPYPTGGWWTWREFKDEDATHSASLVDIKQLEKVK